MKKNKGGRPKEYNKTTTRLIRFPDELYERMVELIDAKKFKNITELTQIAVQDLIEKEHQK